jgi:hypothetical protein
VYGEPCVVEHRYLMWETLRRLHDASDVPWMVVGGFNEIMWGFEHFLANSRPTQANE